MSHDAGAAHGDAGHPPHWDWSMWPAVASLGIFSLALAFSFHFVYHSGLGAAIALGIGVVLVLAGVAGWTSEAMGHGEGLSYGAMGWFILAEAMIFVAFLGTYWFLRLQSPSWPPENTPVIPKVLPLIMTVVLVASSFTIHHAEALLHHGDQAGFRTWLIVTLLLGASFLGMSAYEWSHLMHEGFNVGTNLFGTFFFSITGFHGGHVIVGLSIFLAGLSSAFAGKADLGFWRTAGLYWHFVDIIWFFVVSQIYFW
ncbi:MAG: heme-copper oxidase subunit III [Burkholderiales bacterium]|jgi:cytochrome c oxidase subunit 3|nr:heme-copper oxidase subunit III [Burkholderiales bacterium]MBP7519119.1 heme-copper oxidase subunit III [Leptothrix sp. (in: b-proteobacteria)]HQY07083.1 heme-copper oxidase subunit III [Burkholderiaceae bacterium]